MVSCFVDTIHPSVRCVVSMSINKCVVRSCMWCFVFETNTPYISGIIILSYVIIMLLKNMTVRLVSSCLNVRRLPSVARSREKVFFFGGAQPEEFIWSSGYMVSALYFWLKGWVGRSIQTLPLCCALGFLDTLPSQFVYRSSEGAYKWILFQYNFQTLTRETLRLNKNYILVQGWINSCFVLFVIPQSVRPREDF